MSRRHVLHAVFDERSHRRFVVGVALADALSAGVLLVSRRHRVRPIEVMDGLITQVASYVQAQVPKEEWGDVATVLADELRRRLAVSGDTGEEHYFRRMV